MEFLNKDVIGCIMKWLPRLEQLRLPRLSKAMRRLCEPHTQVVRKQLYELYSPQATFRNLVTAVTNNDAEVYQWFTSRTSVIYPERTELLDRAIWFRAHALFDVILAELYRDHSNRRDNIRECIIESVLCADRGDLLIRFRDDLVAHCDNRDSRKNTVLIWAISSGNIDLFLDVCHILGRTDSEDFEKFIFGTISNGYVHLIRYYLQVMRPGSIAKTLDHLASGMMIHFNQSSDYKLRCDNPRRWEEAARLLVGDTVPPENCLIWANDYLTIVHTGTEGEEYNRIAGMLAYIAALRQGTDIPALSPARPCSCRGCLLVDTKVEFFERRINSQKRV